jgi:hypothetical protein
MESSTKAELFACRTKEVNTSALSSAPVPSILLMSDLSGGW